MPDIVGMVQKIVAPMHRRVMLMIGRAIINIVDDTTKQQTLQLQLMQGVLRDNVERCQEFGFTSVPVPGAEAVTVAVTGNTDHLIALGTSDRRYRPTGLSPGESAVYTTEGVAFYAKCTGALNESGVLPENFAARADRVDASIEQLRMALNAHTHPTGTGPSGTAIIQDPVHASTKADKAMVE